MYRLRKSLLVFTVFLFFYSSASAYDLQVLVTYTQSAKDRYPNMAYATNRGCELFSACRGIGQDDNIRTRIEHLFLSSNTSLERSGVNLRLIPVGFFLVDEPRGPSTLSYQKIHPLIVSQMYFDERFLKHRNTYQADIITLFTVQSNDKICGFAKLPEVIDSDKMGPVINREKWARTALNAVAIECSDDTLLHEIGHNIGLGHSPTFVPLKKASIVKYGTGYGEFGVFETIMGYNQFGEITKAFRFSDPKAICKGGVPCGIAGVSDSVLALNQMAQMAATLAENCPYVWNDNGFNIFCQQVMAPPSNTLYYRRYTIQPQ